MLFYIWQRKKNK